MMNDVVSDSSRIPAWWHEAITGKGQQFESAKEVRMALIYYSIAKKFAFNYVNNEPKRIRASCMFRKETKCPWLLFASPLRNVATFAIKNLFLNIHADNITAQLVTSEHQEGGLRVCYNQL